jgi:hypothetical protein
MRGTRTVLASGFLALVLITGSAARSAADDCLAKPTGPTPQGQHWYYRIDHANNGRQCWYLRAEIGRVQKSARQAEADATEAIAQTVEAPPRRVAPAASVADIPEENAAPVAAPIPWLNVQKLPEPILCSTCDAAKPPTQTLSDGAALHIRQRSAGESDRSSAAVRTALPRAWTATQRRRIAQGRSVGSSQAAPSRRPLHRTSITFALLMIMFASLAIAGPACTFFERRAGARPSTSAAAMGARGRLNRRHRAFA